MKALEVKTTNKINNDKYIMKRLIQYVKPYWKVFLICLIMIFIISASQLARPYIVKIAIDKYIKKALTGELSNNYCISNIKILCFMYFILISLELLLSYMETYILQSTGKKIILNLRQHIFNKIQKLPLVYFDNNAVGRIVTRVTNDTDALNEMFTDVLIGFIQNVFIMIGIVIVMANLNLKLTIVCLLVTPFMFFASLLFKRKARETFGEIRNKLSKINSFISENISGIKIIQVFNMQEKKYEEFEDINKDFYNSSLKQIILFGVFKPFMDVVKILSLALILLYGGISIINGHIEVGTFYVFINYINRLFRPIIELTEQYNTYQSSMVSANRIFEILDENVEEESKKNIKLSEVKGEIEFKHVWFAYEEENWVLKDLSFKISKGQSLAFVGATGAGKSSIINLILGFYKNQKGEILIDGININDLNKAVLRKKIGLVLQDVFLFEGTIKDNIKLFNNEISDKEAANAAEYVNAHNFIKKFKEGYDHFINEKGTVLSMGQRQLLSFARALVIEPSILVMDEATSNIDTETEEQVQQAIERLMKGRTSITIAHRLSTVKKSDIIIVLNKGEIEEMGKHDKLIEKKGSYYNLYKFQYFQK